MRSLRVPLVALLTVLAVLLPGSAFGRSQYFCRMMNRVVTARCCQEQADDLSRAGVRAPDCCEKIAPASRTLAVRATAFDHKIPCVALAGIVSGMSYEVPRHVEAVQQAVRARPPPGVGPPLFIAHCSLLT